MSLSLVRRHQNFVYALPKEVSTIGIQQKKNAFLRCEDLREDLRCEDLFCSYFL